MTVRRTKLFQRYQKAVVFLENASPGMFSFSARRKKSLSREKVSFYIIKMPVRAKAGVEMVLDSGDQAT